MTSQPRHQEIRPSASRLMGSLRDVGYDFVGAVADLIDNSVAAMATRVDIRLRFAGVNSSLTIADNGHGMSPSVVHEAMRFGSRRTYNGQDLGRFGLGLKTASISQCRQLTVATRSAPVNRRIHIRRLDLDHVERVDRWEIEQLDPDATPTGAIRHLERGPGTVVMWAKLDRVLEYHRPDGAWARRRIEQLGSELRDHLGMVFHRFLTGEARRPSPLTITINGRLVEPWDPFARSEASTITLAPRRLELGLPGRSTIVFRPYILPYRSEFSTVEAFERQAGPLKWNRQQGLYFYRSDRLIRGGGWAGIRAIDEHTKYARAAVDFDPDLDGLFRVNVPKMSVSLPGPVRKFLAPAVADLRRHAVERYRHGEAADGDRSERNGASLTNVGAALKAAAFRIGELEALERIAGQLEERDPGLRSELGF